MDYTSASWSFKVRKAVRYVRLYGVRRTLIKIKGQYHSKKAGKLSFDGPRWVNLACKTPNAPTRNIAVIGCGNYAFSNICYYLAKEERSFLRAAYDIDKGKAASLCQEFNGAYAAGDWRDIVADASIKLVFIASNHASHAEYAIPLISAGKHVYIEKPHVVSQDQLSRLMEAMRNNPDSKVFLGFNRPKSALFQKLLGFLERERGPLMINWFVMGHDLPEDHWYHSPEEGGRILGNLCHWTDLTLHLVSMRRAFPCTIIPASPPDATDFLLSVIFADGSCASLTFFASKEHTFEGVREFLNIHKGKLLGSLTDFQRLNIEILDKKFASKPLFRDHGHKANIVNSFRNACKGGAGEDPGYVLNTARFFLAVREAIDEGKPVVLDWDNSFDQCHSGHEAADLAATERPREITIVNAN